MTPFQSLAQVFEERGFPTSPAEVSWDEFRGLTWSAGTVLTDLNPTRREGVTLGYDQRWAYPAFPSTGVDSATTSVQVLRQASRTLPAGTAIVRPIDSVTTKPEVTTVTELTSQQLSQVAAVVSSVPNIHAEQTAFTSMIETDLRLSISEGYDRLVTSALSTAGTLTAGTADIITSVRRGIGQLATAGYAADTLVIDAAGSEQLDLLQTGGSEKFWVWSPGNFAPGLFGLNVRVTKVAGTAVADSQAFGRLYASPLQLQRFEVDAGLSNRSNFRLEGQRHIRCRAADCGRSDHVMGGCSYGVAMDSSPAASSSKRWALSAWSVACRSHCEARRRKYSDRPSSAWRSANFLAPSARASSARASSASRRASSEYVTPAT